MSKDRQPAAYADASPTGVHAPAATRARFEECHRGTDLFARESDRWRQTPAPPVPALQPPWRRPDEHTDGDALPSERRSWLHRTDPPLPRT